jgi:hypothetical protein
MNKTHVSDAARLFGVSRKTLYKWVSKHDIQLETIDAKSYVDISDLERCGYNVPTREVTTVSAVTATVTADDRGYNGVVTGVSYATYPWNEDGAELVEEIEDASERARQRSLHGGYINDDGEWRSTVGGTAALAKQAENTVQLWLRPAHRVTVQQLANWSSSPSR